MARIGDFTPADMPSLDDFSFGYFGTEIRVHPEFGELVFTDWAERFGTLPDDDPRGIMATKTLMQSVVHPDDFAEFWRLARGHRQSTEDLAVIFQSVLEAVTARPTKPQSGSSDGERKTRRNLEGDSFSRAITQYEEQGRPDLAMVVDLARRARTA